MILWGRNHRRILTVEDWKSVAAPAKPTHWQDGHKTFELVRASCKSEMPASPVTSTGAADKLSALHHTYPGRRRQPSMSALYAPCTVDLFQGVKQ